MRMKVADILAPNEEDEDGAYWDPWAALKLPCGGYNSAVDQAAISVLTGIADGLYCDDIAARFDMDKLHVELWQYLFCSADWCEYGTSPRGCFPNEREGFPEIIKAWREYYLRHWKSSAD